MAIGMGSPREIVRKNMIEVCNFVHLNPSYLDVEVIGHVKVRIKMETNIQQKMIQPVGKPPEVQD